MESLPREDSQERRQRAGLLRSEEPLERLENKDARPGWGRSSWRQAGRLGQREQRSWQAGGQAWMIHWRSKLRQQKDKAETEWGYTRLESLGTDRMLCRTLSSLTDLHLLDASWTSQLWKTKVSPEIARCFWVPTWEAAGTPISLDSIDLVVGPFLCCLLINIWVSEGRQNPFWVVLWLWGS